MFCSNCGTPLKEEMIFCSMCGNKIIIEEGIKIVKRKNRIHLWILSVSIFLLIIGIGLFAFLYLRPEAKYERALSKAESYMEEKEYSTAIKYFEKALDIDSTKEVMKKHQKACLKNAEILFDKGVRL